MTKLEQFQFCCKCICGENASASEQVPDARWFAPLKPCVCGQNLIKRDWKTPYKWKVILLVFLSSVITSNFLATTPLNFTYPLLA